jgi:maleylpyruvate isomerase
MSMLAKSVATWSPREHIAAAMVEHPDGPCIATGSGIGKGTIVATEPRPRCPLRHRRLRRRRLTVATRPALGWRTVAAEVASLRWSLLDKPTAEIEGCREAHARLATAIGAVTNSVARRPTLLPGWTVGHVLSHLARNAEAMVRRIEAASRGEVIDQYMDGVDGRASEIEAGAGRPAHELMSDMVNWSRRLDATFESLPDDCWGRPVRGVQGVEHPVAQLPFRRWREVEVHLVDLDIGFGPVDWSQPLVDRALPRLMAGLVDRADHRSLMAWMLGRGLPPTLDPWG